jgi:ankyrin repeat protein
VRRGIQKVATLVAAGLVALGGQTRAQSPQETLWDAAMTGDTAAMAQALAAGAQVDSLDTRRTANGRRALNWAALYNHVGAIRFLLAHGARLDASNHTGFTALHHAAEVGSLDVARVLLAAGADPWRPNNDGLRPSEIARERGNAAVASVLEAAERTTPRRPDQ